MNRTVPLGLGIFGDPAGILGKLYSGNLSAQSPRAESPCSPLFIETATMAHEILTIRFIKLSKYSSRRIPFQLIPQYKII
ncbi:MAG: hypothetical protein A2156_02735 [Deltaproteobacteria bacterium RBG_16_48_10]|nr:MAG: hypothetical protein A2156_02735 [Deltaproteobacteria bacterium RBG_16_48_10]